MIMTLVGDPGLVFDTNSHGSSQTLSNVSYICICDGGCSDVYATAFVEDTKRLLMKLSFITIFKNINVLP